MLRTMSIVLLVASVNSFARADGPSADEAAIRKAVESYVEAFNRRDAKALAAHWSPDGVYTSRVSGEQIVGRQSLEAEFAAQFEDFEDARVEVKVDSIDFISPNVALEQGTATVIGPNETPDKSSYSAVHVKRDGKWLIDRVSEEDEEDEAPKIVSHYEQLKDLEWMIGKWVDQAGGDIVTTECHWTRNRNHLTRSFTVTIEDRVGTGAKGDASQWTRVQRGAMGPSRQRAQDGPRTCRTQRARQGRPPSGHEGGTG